MNSPVFLDSSCFIYLLEDHPKYAPKTSEIFDDVSLGKLRAFSSIIALTEVLTKPYQMNDKNLISRYLEFFNELQNFELIIPDLQASIESAKIRAKYNLNLPDSYQITMAIMNKCKTFLTNDINLKKIKEIEVVCLEDLI